MNEDFLLVDFPFRKLVLKIHRRDVLHSLLKHFSGTLGQVNQKPTFTIEDLGTLSIDSLQKITPALYAGCEFKSDAQFIYGKAPRHTEFIKLFLKGSPAHTMFQFFNQDRSIHQISISARKRFPLTETDSLLFIRGLFLFLTEHVFAYPKTGVPNDDE
jgi:hypothetical protein